ncbi:tetratricopeptide repeat protein [Seonamhaeicola marinus]|uniref:Tetratricopeptide repeat protein n=1 Tax=Seonamhaeicola marinus TaxID=1912246 RepID=A0A5D0HU31_9FLAO|nr:tetratricopeptide repeat protein [Seonamhaeicola marinus]TYA73969.1 tetratricopeptide repeat protein [Seonamhaeicola marinus]
MLKKVSLAIFTGLLYFNSLGQTVKNNSLISNVEQDLETAKTLISTAYYPEAYDKVWNALIISDSINNPKGKFEAYKSLTLLYSIFYSKEKALSSIDSMFVYAKKLDTPMTVMERSNLNYTAAHTYRMNKDYDLAKKYLDISEHILDSVNSSLDQKLYVIAEKAHLYTLTGNYKASEEILTKIIKHISDSHDYASIIYSMLGDLYIEKGEPTKALEFFNKCLNIISEKNIRIGLKVELLEKISNLNKEQGNYELAYQQMAASKTLGDSLFGSQSQRNKKLFEIKDSYRTSIIENNRLKREQELQHIKAQKEKLNLQLLFSVVLFLVTVTVTFFGVRLIRKKHTVEKKLATERANAEVEIKKKELAVTALQLMEKDKLLEEIKRGLEAVKTQEDDKSVEQIKSTIKINAAKTWEEFEARFVQVNNSFYESLGKKHTNLSRNELKLCALVKLNFSTKEMAELLGVSADSVNKARYRLRKKLGLHRDDNLVTYINSI